MGEFIKASKTSEFEDRTKKKLLIQGQEILLARVDDKYYAASNRCPHLGGDLYDGKLEGTIVTCPRHSSQFDLKDGAVVRWLKGSGFFSAVGKAFKPPKQLKTYSVRVEGEDILVEI